MSRQFVFRERGDFAAKDAAEAWCAANGMSVGRMERDKPRGILIGDFDIQKWHNLRPHERLELDGQMTGDMRNGPVFVTLKDDRTPSKDNNQ